MSSNEVVDTAVGTYQELGPMMLSHTVLPTLLCVAAFAFLSAYVFPTFGVTSHPDQMIAQVGEVITTALIALVVAGPLFVIGLSYTSAFVTGLVSDAMVGNMPDPSTHLKRARAILPKLVGLTFWEILTSLGGLVIGGILLMTSAMLSSNIDTNMASGAVAFIAVIAIMVGFLSVPFVLSRHLLAVPVVVLEGLKPRQAIKRSVDLMRRLYHNESGYNSAVSLMFLSLFLGAFLVLGLFFTFSALDLIPFVDARLANSGFHDLAVEGLKVLPWFLMIWTVVPLWCTGATVLYYERRTRLEGYDIEALAQDLWKHAKQNRFEL